MDKTLIIDGPTREGPGREPRAGVRGDGFGAGDFELGDLLSDTGGMALVYLAYQKSFGGRRVVAKRLRPEFSLDREAAACRAFRDEGRKMAALGAHPNIVQVYYYDDANLTLYMEFVQGKTLDQCIELDGYPPAGRAVAIMSEVLDGLAFIHRADVIHLDIKPGNIFQLHDGHIKISDFGIAGQAAQRIRSGTPGYCSPEQALGHPVDPRSDVYSAGVLLFELLAGRPPFRAKTMEDYAATLQSVPVPDLLEALPNVPAALRTVVGKALQTRVADRYSGAQEFKDHLVRAWQVTTLRLDAMEKAAAAAAVSRTRR